jgi:hypothetical protein
MHDFDHRLARRHEDPIDHAAPNMCLQGPLLIPTDVPWEPAACSGRYEWALFRRWCARPVRQALIAVAMLLMLAIAVAQHTSS